MSKADLISDLIHEEKTERQQSFSQMQDNIQHNSEVKLLLT